MARWTVVAGPQEIVIESIHPGELVSVDIPSGGPFISGVEAIRDLRTKLGLAIGDVQPGKAPASGDSAQAQNPAGRHSQGGESDA